MHPAAMACPAGAHTLRLGPCGLQPISWRCKVLPKRQGQQLTRHFQATADSLTRSREQVPELPGLISGMPNYQAQRPRHLQKLGP